MTKIVGKRYPVAKMRAEAGTSQTRGDVICEEKMIRTQRSRSWLIALYYPAFYEV
jgi:hypothetical protein